MSIGNVQVASTSFCLPFKRVIVISDASNRNDSRTNQVALALIPIFLSRVAGVCGDNTIVVLADSIGGKQFLISADHYQAHNCNMNSTLSSMMSTCREAEIKIDLKRVLFTVAAARDTEATLFIPNLSDDLFVLFSAQHAKSNHIRTILQSLTELGGSSAINGTNSGCLLLLADEFTREVVWGAACQLPGWRVFGCFVPFWGPPCGDQELTVSAASCHQAGAGLLESVALGVALGTVKQLPLLFTDSVYVVPLDLGVSAAVVFVSLCLRKVSSLLFPATGVVLEVLPNGDGLVWGMFSKYLLDYYSCVRHKEGEVFPVQWMLDASPILHLEVRARDWLTYGVSPKILKSFYGSAAIKRRDQLTKYRPDSSVGIKINEVVKDIDARVRDLVQVTRRFGSVSSRGICSPPGCREHVQKTTFVMDYASFLKEVALDASLRPLHALISLSSVKWDIYVKATAYATLERTARQFGERKCQLPLPVPHFHNDIVFHGAQSAPLNGRFTHGYIGNIQWAFWCGMQPNGQRVKTAPGLTRSAVTHILEQPIVIRAIEEETQSTEGGHIESVRARAATLLRGIGDSMNQFHIRALGVIVRRTLFKLYDEVFVNDEAFGRLYKAANTPRVLVVLLPAHRSYMDFIIVTYLLIVMGIPPPHICAGDDFTRLGAVTKFMRGSGAFFMRRSFRNDRLYYALFREYVRHLVRQRHTLEFFIEGTRSRTGKAQRPMLGLLKFVIEAAHDARDVIDDVQIFPISLSYDELLEAKLYADEQLGVPKPKENIKNLLHARSLLDRKRGKIHLHVAKPLSLQCFRDRPNQCPTPFESIEVCKNTTELYVPNRLSGTENAEQHASIPGRVLTNLAWHVTHITQKNTVITPTALLSIILSTFFQGPCGAALKEMAMYIMWLRRQIIKRGGKLSVDGASSDGETLARIALSHLEPFVLVCRSNYGETVVIRQNERALMGVAIYGNQLIHIFVDEAVVAVVAQALGEPVSSRGEFCAPVNAVKSDCQQLRTLLSGEFQDYLSTCPYTHDSWFKQAVDRLVTDYDTTSDDRHGDVNYENRSSEGASCGNVDVTGKQDAIRVKQTHSGTTFFITPGRYLHFLAGVLAPFLESLYFVSLASCAMVEAGLEATLQRKRIVSVCQGSGLQLSKEGRVILHSQAYGNESLKNALHGLAKCAGFELNTNGSEATFVLTDSSITATGAVFFERMQPIVEWLKKFLTVQAGALVREEQYVQSIILKVYHRQLQSNSAHASKM